MGKLKIPSNKTFCLGTMITYFWSPDVFVLMGRGPQTPLRGRKWGFYPSVYRNFAIISRPYINFLDFLVRLIFENWRKLLKKHRKKALLVLLLFKYGFYSNAAYNSENTYHENSYLLAI